METIFKAKWNYNWFQTLLPGGPIHNPLCLVLFMSTPGHTGANNLFSVLAQTQKCFQNLISKVFNRSWSFENFTSFPGRSFLRLSGVFCVLLIHAPKILDLWILGAWFLRSYSCGHGTQTSYLSNFLHQHSFRILKIYPKKARKSWHFKP